MTFPPKNNSKLTTIGAKAFLNCKVLQGSYPKEMWAQVLKRLKIEHNVRDAFLLATPDEKKHFVNGEAPVFYSTTLRSSLARGQADTNRVILPDSLKTIGNSTEDLSKTRLCSRINCRNSSKN